MDDESHLPEVKAYLEAQIKRRGLPLQIKTWAELSPLYTKVKRMFDIIFNFVFIIVFMIVVTSVINTVTMSIIERTKEIGTLRALGLKRRGVIKLFAVESAMLGLLGCLLGIVLTIFCWLLVKVIEPQWVPPNIPREIPLEVYLIPSYLIVSFFFLLTLATLVAILPARKACGKPIVDALDHS
ncbi:ABC transporter permease [Desulfoferrobacter suflitae]|uniref:ABC transporter permease n=1 Tax=Desulfoferrobacter suflitae TaxID=2865782 RepID=UPI0021646608|nr:FtsX-like permease family protein [Desulfoferrobacter suflitae]MCK8604150.1 FtsX-like permease family protein [Desulfoferrobacter suflitae]